MARNFDRHINRQQRRALRAQGAWIPLRRMTPVPPSAARMAELREHAAKLRPDFSAEQLDEVFAAVQSEGSEIWANDLYQVHVIRWPARPPIPHPVVQLSIRRLDRQAARDWRHFQQIKNDLVGPECEAIELYPAESRLVDTATQFHLWCVNDPYWRFPLGYDSGRVVSGEAGGAVQRPLMQITEAGK
jgi:hypothetical protein